MEIEINLRPTWIEIRKNDIYSNVSIIKEYIKKFNRNAKLIAVVKGNACGHNAIKIAPTIIEAGADILATGILEEAIALRKAGIRCPILVLGYTTINQARLIVENDIIQNVCTIEMAKALSSIAKEKNKEAKIHIKVDTGLGRLGVLNNEVVKFVKSIFDMPNIIVDGIYTHLATAHTGDIKYLEFQVNKFRKAIQMLVKNNLPTGIKHVANSAATLISSEYHFDAVRCGSLIYGTYSSELIPKRLNLKPAFNLYSKVVFIKKVPRNTYIGYGNSFTTKRESIIGVLPIGFADGLSRGFSGKISVLIRGQRAPLISTINMDSCIVDLTDINGAKVGDKVVIIGKDGNQEITVFELSKILHEEIGMILLNLGNSRIPHVFI